MQTIFLSGSRSIRYLNNDIIERVRGIITKKFNIIIGDANGADKVLQKLLSDFNYKKVVIFCAGHLCRNNLDDWKTNNIEVSKNLKGRDFYTAKDKEMALKADYGLVLWDGKSAGSINNIIELLKGDKSVVVYFYPDEKFYTIKTNEDIRKLLSRCEVQYLELFSKKIKLNKALSQLQERDQETFVF